MAAWMLTVAMVALAKVFWKLSVRRPSDHVVRVLAERSVEPVCRRLRVDLLRMSTSEMRGYVRARGLGVVRRQALLVAAESDDQTPLPEHLVTRSLERTVHLVMRRLTTGALVLPASSAAG